MLTVPRRCLGALRLLSPVFFLLVLAITVSAQPAHAASSYSCDEAGLDAAMATGGSATFDCTVATTIHTAGLLTVTTSVNLDGGNLLTITGDGAHGLFSVTNSTVTLTLQNMTLTGGTVTGTAGGDAGGGAIVVQSGGLVVNHCTFTNNTAIGGDASTPGTNGGSGRGGAIMVMGSNTPVMISDSTFLANSVSGGKGSPTVQNPNAADGLAEGGALYTSTFYISIVRSTFSQNSAGNGGAVSSNGYVSFTDSSFDHNTADYGGAVFNYYAAKIVGSTFSVNTARNAGGGFFQPFRTDYGHPLFNNDTFAGNQVSGVSNGINGGGAIAFSSLAQEGPPASFEIARLTNVTLSGNGAAQGGALYIDPTLSSSIFVQNTIIANSTNGGNCAGLMPFGINSVQWPGTTCGAYPIIDPQLGPLADNGGPTPTFLPAATSPVIDAGSDSACSTNTDALTDQRGLPRWQGSHCDIGAVEQRGGAYLDYTLNPTIIAGTVLALRVTAKDNADQIDTGYTGTVHFTSDDPQADLPADYIFTPADAGVHTFTVVLKTAGNNNFFTGIHNLNLYDLNNPAFSTTRYTTINAAPVSNLHFSNYRSEFLTGQPFSLNAYPSDAYGNFALDYTGTIHFTSSDPQAMLPSDYTWPGGLYSNLFFGVTFNTAGSQTLTVTDTARPAYTDTVTFTVDQTLTDTLRIDLPPTVIAGQPFAYTVSAVAPGGKVDTNFVREVDTVTQETGLQDQYTYRLEDKGVHTFVTTLHATGTVQTVTANVPYAMPATNTVASTTVIAGTPTLLKVTYPGYRVAGELFPLTVTAQDAAGNLNANYTGTIHFSDHDPTALLPPDYSFTSSDMGAHTFQIAFGQSNFQYLTITDTTGSPAFTHQLSIGPRLVTNFAMDAMPTSIIGGTSANVTLVAFDAQDAIATNAQSTVHFSSSDPQALLPADYTFTPADHGFHTFSVTPYKVGDTTFAVADVTDASVNASVHVTVTPVPKALHLAFSTQPVGGTINTLLPIQPVVSVLDNADHVVTGFSGTISVALTPGSGPAGASLTGTTTVQVVNGSASFHDLSIDTAGTYSLTATNADLDTITSQTFSISDPVPAKLVFSVQPAGSVQATSQLAQQPQVAVQDAQGHTILSYSGTVSLALGSGTSTGAAHLTGNTSVLAVHGVAVFTDVGIDTAGLGYVITASVPSVSSVDSFSLDILPQGAYLSMALRLQPQSDPHTYTATLTLRNLTGADLPQGTPVTFTFANLHFVARDTTANHIDGATWQSLTTHRGIAALTSPLHTGETRTLTLHLHLTKAATKAASLQAMVTPQRGTSFTSNMLRGVTQDGATLVLTVTGAPGAKAGKNVRIAFTGTVFAAGEPLLITVTPLASFGPLPAFASRTGLVHILTWIGLAPGTYSVSVYGWYSGVRATGTITLT